MVTKNILEVNQLIKYFKGENEAVLKNITLQIEQGEYTVIMGHSGSGKTTLLYCMSGMDEINSGEVLFNGTMLHKLKETEISYTRLKSMGFIFQHSYLLKNLTIQENIHLPSLQLKKIRKEDTIREAKYLMRKLQIDDISDHEITKVSGGQLQRAAIGRALINQPDILFGDEPTGALHSNAALEVMDIFQDINHNGTTILLVTHDSRVALRADRVIFLSDGRIRSEHIQGKYEEETDLEARSIKLNKWLKEQNF